MCRYQTVGRYHPDGKYEQVQRIRPCHLASNGRYCRRTRRRSSRTDPVSIHQAEVSNLQPIPGTMYAREPRGAEADRYHVQDDYPDLAGPSSAPAASGGYFQQAEYALPLRSFAESPAPSRHRSSEYPPTYSTRLETPFGVSPPRSRPTVIIPGFERPTQPRNDSGYTSPISPVTDRMRSPRSSMQSTGTIFEEDVINDEATKPKGPPKVRFEERPQPSPSSPRINDTSRERNRREAYEQLNGGQTSPQSPPRERRQRVTRYRYPDSGSVTRRPESAESSGIRVYETSARRDDRRTTKDPNIPSEAETRGESSSSNRAEASSTRAESSSTARKADRRPSETKPSMPSRPKSNKLYEEMLERQRLADEEKKKRT